MESDVYPRLAELERSNRLLRLWLLPGVTMLAVLTGAAALGFTRPQRPTAPVADSLLVRELIIVDSQGTVRVRVGSHLPDAVANGRPVPRGEDVAGVLLYDDEGRERGGYVTFSPSRNVALTLDTRYRQVALFAADSNDGVAARLWSGTNWVDMRADTMGAHLSIGHSRELVFQQPPMTEAETAAGCSELKAELTHVAPQPPRERVLAACKEHMPDAACRKCLGIP